MSVRLEIFLFIGELALVMAAFFTGAAFFINFAEQPGRLQLEPGPLLTQWTKSYKRGFALQAPLALLCGICGIIAFYISREWSWLAGAILILLNMPYTILVMMPINRKLLATPVRAAGDETANLIAKWGSLHMVRTLLGLGATVAYFFSPK
jgi:hypothetical protein